VRFAYSFAAADFQTHSTQCITIMKTFYYIC